MKTTPSATALTLAALLTSMSNGALNRPHPIEGAMQQGIEERIIPQGRLTHLHQDTTTRKLSTAIEAEEKAALKLAEKLRKHKPEYGYTTKQQFIPDQKLIELTKADSRDILIVRHLEARGKHTQAYDYLRFINGAKKLDPGTALSLRHLDRESLIPRRFEKIESVKHPNGNGSISVTAVNLDKVSLGFSRIKRTGIEQATRQHALHQAKMV